MWTKKLNTTHKKLPRYKEIIQLVEYYIEQGKLSGGQKLPAERELALFLGVNRSTVIRALEELTERGILIRKQGSGTFVNPDKWGLQSRVVFTWKLSTSDSIKNLSEKNAVHKKETTPLSTKDNEETTHKEQDYQEEIHSKSNEDRQSSQSKKRKEKYSYREEFNNLSIDQLSEDLLPTLSLPATSWRELIREEQNIAPDATLLGFSPLRKSIQYFLAQHHNLDVPEEQILITSGIQQAIFLTTQCLLKPGDAIGIESPSYFYSLPVFQAAGLRLCSLPMDDEGITLDGLDEQVLARRLKMIFLNPVFHNPTGTVMSLHRKKEILEYCEAKRVPIFEDDAYSLLSFNPGLDTSPIKCLDKNNRVIYAGSLSSYAGHRLRIGWVIAPEPVTMNFAEVRHHMGSGVSLLPQTMARIYLDQNFLEHRLELWEQLCFRAHSLYGKLQSTCPHGIEVTRPQGGLYLYAKERYSQTKEAKKKKGTEATPLRLWLEKLRSQRIIGANGAKFGATENSIRFNFSWYI